MSLHFDFHLHTSRYSGDSQMEPYRLIRRAVKAGLQGVVITEHHRVWPQDELNELIAEADVPGFMLLSGFEYTSRRGDILIYGLNQNQCATFVPGELEPAEAVARATDWGAACIAAHPTRQGLGFDERIFDLPLSGIEVQSCNLNTNEQRLGFKLAEQLGVPMTASSDAHRIEDVGKYATEITAPVSNMTTFVEAIKQGQFRLPTATTS